MTWSSMKADEQLRIYDSQASINAFLEAEADRVMYWSGMVHGPVEPRGVPDRRPVYFLRGGQLLMLPRDARSKRFPPEDA